MKKVFYTSRKLIKDLKKGNENAYAFIVKTYYKPLSNYAFGLSRNTFKAEDIVQNVFIRIWEQRSKLKQGFSLKSFLYKAVYNEFANQYRKEISINKMEKKYYESINPLYEEKSEELDRLMLLVEKEIEQLPPRCKETFLLSKREGLTYVEIAVYLNVSIKTVENQMSIAFSTIRKKMDGKL
ncbi:RNA polymerase sigma-70 factor (ECF subfamily) [Gillisia sp. Hel_I_86]|uniref:RNA polymerase sigma factor n=1 Tax=Gillisia sp. Hel_I_86 TaxID=1249981 RepID=UPI00119932DD|nr:sigma-70 family RNA polymerase sigma factor [Gillisia sp. Hel_I_86]TVZ27648.1 RNA polymerase sigma-70 factor (ECF subfamily) [Gillisia sp. Hel_I_86]